MADVLVNSTNNLLERMVDMGDGSFARLVNTTGSASSQSVSSLSAGNSSAVNLAGGATFAGTAVDWTAYGSVTVTVFASHASATNGLSIEQSSDNVNWDVADQYTVSATAKTSINVPRQEKYLRIRYTNGATLTTSFRLQTFLNSFQSRPVSARPGDGMTIENDFDQAISVQTTYNGATADLQRSIVNATNSIGTGIMAAGLVAQLDDVTPTAITENQFGNLRMTANRALLVYPNASPADAWNFASAASGIVNTTTAVTLKTAAAAGVRNYLQSMQINTDTLGSATELAVRDGAAGTVLWRGKLQTTALPMTTINFDPPLKGTAATLMEVVTLTASVTGGVYVNAQGFTGP